MQLGADVREVAFGRAEAVAGQPHAVAVDVHELARHAGLVEGPQCPEVHAAVVGSVAVAHPERAVGRRAHRADRVRGAVGRDAVERVVGRRAGAVDVRSEDDPRVGYLIRAIDLDAHELRDHRRGAVLRAHSVEVVGVEQVQVAVLGELRVHGQAQQSPVGVVIDPRRVVGDQAGRRATRRNHLQRAVLLGHEHAAVGRPGHGRGAREAAHDRLFLKTGRVGRRARFGSEDHHRDHSRANRESREPHRQ